MNAKWLAAIGGGFILIGGSAVAVSGRLLSSSSASRLGIENKPDNQKVIDRLIWLDLRVTEVLSLLLKNFPAAHLTSAYRNSEVNAAVGGSPTSLHKEGLAFDVGGIADPFLGAKFLRDNLNELKVKPRTVIAETSPIHVHLDYFDPLGIIKTDTLTSKFLGEYTTNKFTGLV